MCNGNTFYSLHVHMHFTVGSTNSPQYCMCTTHALRVVRPPRGFGGGGGAALPCPMHVRARYLAGVAPGTAQAVVRRLRVGAEHAAVDAQRAGPEVLRQGRRRGAVVAVLALGPVLRRALPRGHGEGAGGRDGQRGRGCGGQRNAVAKGRAGVDTSPWVPVGGTGTPRARAERRPPVRTPSPGGCRATPGEY